MRLLTLFGCAALGLVLSAPTKAETIKIGVLFPYSGANADLGDVADKALDLYVKLHAKDILPHKVELIKRDEGPPSGANAKTAATELITRDKVNLLFGVIYSPSAIGMAPVVTQAKTPLIISNAGTAWITKLSPYIVRFSFSMWHDGYVMGSYAADGDGLYRFPAGQGLDRSLQDQLRKGRRQGGRRHSDGQSGAGARHDAVLPAHQGRETELHVRVIPSGSHAAAVVRTYDQVGLRQAGVKLIGPKDVVPDSKLQGMGDAAV